MSRQPYPTDLTDQQWQLIASLIPTAKDGGRPRTTDVRSQDRHYTLFITSFAPDPWNP